MFLDRSPTNVHLPALHNYTNLCSPQRRLGVVGRHPMDVNALAVVLTMLVLLRNLMIVPLQS